MSVSCGSMGCTSSSNSFRPKLKAPCVVQNMKYSASASSYVTPVKRPYQCCRQNGEEPREAGKEGIQERRDGIAGELPREYVEGELEQPEEGGDNREDPEKEGKHGQQRVVVLVVQMLRAQPSGNPYPAPCRRFGILRPLFWTPFLGGVFPANRRRRSWRSRWKRGKGGTSIMRVIDSP